MTKHLAGIIPVAGIKTDFDMPWHPSLMPLAPNYLAVERAVVECAYAGCDTIWIVCNDDVTPLIRYHVGEMVQDYVYNYRHFEFNKQDHQRPIRIYYVPLRIRDINKRDNLAWSAIYGARTANKVLKSISLHLAPSTYWIAWPYGFTPPSVPRPKRQDILNKNVMIRFEGRTVKDNLYLGLTLKPEQVKQLIAEARTRSSGLWRNPETRDERLPLDERYSYRNFNLQKVFETLDDSDYIYEDAQYYYSLDNWENYCNFIKNNSELRKPKILKSVEWNDIGVDD